MANRNNELNQARRRRIHESLSLAAAFLTEGKKDRAKVSLGIAAEELSQAPWNGGKPWAEAFARYREVAAMFTVPCNCWCCAFTTAQKVLLKTEVTDKAADLATAYPDDENNYIGAFAEVVFGIHFNLPLNKIRGFDGGKDFSIPCASTPTGILTIDVKGTTHARSKDGKIISQFPRQPNWVTRADHIYVLLQIVDKEHAHFRGFAFGNDKCEPQVYDTGEKKYFFEAPGPRRGFEELESLLLSSGL